MLNTARKLALVRLNTTPEMSLKWLTDECKRLNIPPNFRKSLIDESSRIMADAKAEADRVIGTVVG